MPHPEDEPEEGWTPEKEKSRDPDRLMSRHMKILEEKVLPMMEGSHQERTMPAFVGIGAAEQISIRRIRNGFLMSYYEAIEQPGQMGSGPIHIPRHAEVFLATPEDGAALVREALQNAELLARSAEKIRAAYEAQVRQVAAAAAPGEFRGPRGMIPPRPPTPPAAAAPPSAAVGPDEETRKLDRPDGPALI